jgi:F-type H+-transporting ATPase subunit a
MDDHGPLQQFLIKKIIPWQFMGVDLSFTNASLFMCIATFLPIALFIFSRRQKGLIPSYYQSILEISYRFVADMLQETSEEKGLPFFPLVFSLFMFVLFGNMLGMIPYGFTFTSHLAVTFGLASLIFLIITFIGIIKHRGKFFALFVPPGVPWLLMPIMIPIELLSYLSRPVSLAVRLFANMMAGHTMLKVFGSFTVVLGLLGIAPLAINVALVGFEFLVSFLQAYVFTILTCIYLHDALYLHGKGH